MLCVYRIHANNTHTHVSRLHTYIIVFHTVVNVHYIHYSKYQPTVSKHAGSGRFPEEQEAAKGLYCYARQPKSCMRGCVPVCLYARFFFAGKQTTRTGHCQCKGKETVHTQAEQLATVLPLCNELRAAPQASLTSRVLLACRKRLYYLRCFKHSSCRPFNEPSTIFAAKLHDFSQHSHTATLCYDPLCSSLLLLH